MYGVKRPKGTKMADMPEEPQDTESKDKPPEEGESIGPRGHSLTLTPGNNQVSLSWGRHVFQDGNEATEYRIYRRIGSSGDFTRIETTAGSARSYTDTGLTAGTPHYYRLDAWQNHITNRGSTVSATPTETITAPAAPSLSVSGTYTSRTLSWNPGSGGGAATHYTVRFWNGSIWVVVASNLSSGTRSYTHSTTLTESGTYYYTIQAVNSAGTTNSNQATINVIVPDPNLTPTAPNISNRSATVGTTYSQTLGAGSGGDPPLSYSVSSLPPGLSFNTSTRVISGTPTTVGTTTVTYTVTDDDGDSDTDAFTITVSAAGTTNLTPTAPNISNRSATVGTTYSQTLGAGSGGDPPLSYSVSSLPPGLSFNTSTRVISGTPTTVGTTTVTYTVTDDDGDSDTDAFTITVSAAAITAPGTPTSFEVSSTSDSAITVTWSAGSGGTPTSYELQYKRSSDSNYSDSSDDTSPATVSTLDSDTTYNFRVRARNSGGVSNYATTSGTTDEQPSFNSLRATAGDGQVALRWNRYRLQSNTRPWASSYGVFRFLTSGQNPKNNPNNRIAVVNASDESGTQRDFSYTDTSVTSGTTYYYVLLAYRGGARVSSNEVSARPTAPTVTVPGSPANFEVLSTTDTSISVTWSAPTTGGTPTNYELQYKRSSDSNYSDSPDDTSPATISTLDANTTYNFRVRARNSGGAGNYASVNGTTEDTPASYNFSATPGVGLISLSWSAHSNTDWTSFHIEYQTTGIGWTHLHVGGRSNRTHTHNGLTAGQLYSYRARWSTSDNSHNTAYTSTISATPTAAVGTAPDAPTNLRVTNSTTTLLSFSWDAPTTGGEPTAYEYQYKLSTAANYPDDSSSSLATAASLTELAEGTTYNFRVRATNASGQSGWVTLTATTTTTTATTAPGVPTNLAVTALSTTQLSFTWEAPASGGTPRGYNSQSRLSTDTWPTMVGSETTGFGLSRGPVSPGETIVFRVRAINNIGSSAFVMISYTVPGVSTEVPGSVTGLFTGEATDNSVTVTWSAPTDGGIPDGYHVQFKRNVDSLYQNAPDTISPSVITGLDSGILYDVQVRGYNTTGNGDWSGDQITTTGDPADESAAPGTPTAIFAIGLDADTINVSWNPPVSGGTTISYEIQYRRQGTSNWTEVTGIPSTSRGLHGLQASTTYQIQIRARNSMGASDWVPSIPYTAATIVPNIGGSCFRQSHAGFQVDARSTGVLFNMVGTGRNWFWWRD